MSILCLRSQPRNLLRKPHLSSALTSLGSSRGLGPLQSSPSLCLRSTCKGAMTVASTCLGVKLMIRSSTQAKPSTSSNITDSRRKRRCGKLAPSSPLHTMSTITVSLCSAVETRRVMWQNVRSTVSLSVAGPPSRIYPLLETVLKRSSWTSTSL